MDVFGEYLDNIENPQHRIRMEEIFSWVEDKFPSFVRELKWNQPMYTDHGTFIIGFSISKKHMSVSPEETGMVEYTDEIKKAGYEQTKGLFRIPWNRPVDYALLEKMIDFNVMDKADCTTFWR